MPQCPHITKQSSFLSHLGSGSFASVVPTNIPENYDIKIISVYMKLIKKNILCACSETERDRGD